MQRRPGVDEGCFEILGRKARARGVDLRHQFCVGVIVDRDETGAPYVEIVLGARRTRPRSRGGKTPAVVGILVPFEAPLHVPAQLELREFVDLGLSVRLGNLDAP